MIYLGMRVQQGGGASGHEAGQHEAGGELGGVLVTAHHLKHLIISHFLQGGFKTLC